MNKPRFRLLLTKEADDLTPAKEINKAERIRKEYFDLKRSEQ